MNFLAFHRLFNQLKTNGNVFRQFHALSSGYLIPFGALPPTGPSISIARTKIRNFFPKPRENKRMKCHGWWARLKTNAGKKIIMRRILKGKYSLAHGW